MVYNLKPVKTPTDNALTVRTKSGNDVADANNVIVVAIPDANGFTFRERAAAYLSGTSVITLADGQAYWGKASLAASTYTAYLYAIWDGTGIVFALCGYSGLTLVSTTVTVTDPHFMLVEGSSTYVKNAAHFCVTIAKVIFTYNVAGAPDYILSDSMQIVWGRDPSDVYTKVLENTALAFNMVAAADWTYVDNTNSRITFIAPRTGKYRVGFKFSVEYDGASNDKLSILAAFALTSSLGANAFDAHNFYKRVQIATAGGEYHLIAEQCYLEHDFECVSGESVTIDLVYKATLTKGTAQAGSSNNITRMRVTEITQGM
jgi:hypothetical protein